MNHTKIFTLNEARALVPVLKAELKAASEELSALAVAFREAQEAFQQAENRLETENSCDSPQALETLRSHRAGFQVAIEELSTRQRQYMQRLNWWVEKITSHGVILRDINEGLLDFPACENGLHYLLCWRRDEDDIGYWHGEKDGFSGRKTLASLSEFTCST